ncbi:VacJ family lipoprotein [Candidatus Nitrotoga arctica]|nr:VacJ family lipoprotein [Candidatus Nitrotoga arctica]
MSSTRIYLLLVSLALGGCASTQGERNPQDPLEPFNRSMYKFNDAVDKAVLKPVAKGYNTIIPEPGKIMVTNFFSNLDDIIVTINDLLQLKFAQAASDGTRVLFNSTFGILGLFNITDRLEKHNEDFGQTLGYWGISSGPYVVLPFFGPRTVRDSIGLYADSYASPIRLIPNIPTRNEMYVARTISLRAGLLDQEKILEEAAIDRYAFIRDAYLQQRQSLVYDGNPPREKFDDEESSDIPDKISIEDKQENSQPAVVDTPKPAVVDTPVPQHSMESPVQQPSSDAASSVQPIEMGLPVDTSFNPYKIEQPIPTTTENPMLN